VVLYSTFSLSLEKTRLKGAVIMALHILVGSRKKNGNNLHFPSVMKKRRINTLQLQ